MVKINGEELNIAGKTVAEYLATTSYAPKRIAVERNGDIVPKEKLAEWGVDYIISNILE